MNEERQIMELFYASMTSIALFIFFRGFFHGMGSSESLNNKSR